jgi:protein PhnA
MKRAIPTLSEASMVEAEARIPELAAKAGRAAHDRALKSRGVVVKADKGQLVEARSDGTIRVIKPLPAPVRVKAGAVLTRRK